MNLLRAALAAMSLPGALMASTPAHGESVDYVAIVCDTGRGSLLVSKRNSPSREEVPRGAWIKALDDMIGTKRLSKDDAIQFPTTTLERTCTLGKAHYTARLRAVVFGSHTEGRCGAADPGVEVSVWRDKVQLLDKFLMVDNCGDTGTSGLDVSRLDFSEPSHAMRLGAKLDDDAGGAAPFERVYDLESTPRLTLEQVWADRSKPQPGAAKAATAPFVDAQAVEGGLVPKLDLAKLSGPTRLCGWWDNPTPGNVSLTDRGGEWTIALQGMYEAHGDGPDFKPGQQLPKGSPHGYGCACITARVDAASRFVYSFTDAKALPPSVCRADPALKKSGYK